MSFNPWQFKSPFIPYTTIRAEEVNPNFNGISASFSYVADELNNYRPRLPDNFTGNIQLPTENYFNSLIGVDENGDMAFIDMATFKLAGEKDIAIVNKSSQQFNVSGEDHNNFYVAKYETSAGENIEVIVGEALSSADGVPAAAPGTVIFFTQDSNTPLTFAPIPGVTIKTPGILQAYGRNSTVVLFALDQYTWLLGGDVMPTEIEV